VLLLRFGCSYCAVGLQHELLAAVGPGTRGGLQRPQASRRQILQNLATLNLSSSSVCFPITSDRAACHSPTTACSTLAWASCVPTSDHSLTLPVFIQLFTWMCLLWRCLRIIRGAAVSWF
jgi:hypothetical protein